MKRKAAEETVSEEAKRESSTLLPLEESLEPSTSRELIESEVPEIQNAEEARSFEELMENEPLNERSPQPSTSKGFEPLRIENPQPSTSKEIVDVEENEDIEEEQMFENRRVRYDSEGTCSASEGEENIEQDILMQVLRDQQTIVENEVLEEEQAPQDDEEVQQDDIRCIVKPNFHFKQMQELNRHNPTISCNIEHMDVIKTRHDGLKTIWTYKCQMCKYEKEVFSEPVKSTDMDLNKSAVAATLTTGGAYTQLQENLSAMNIKCMSSRQYRKHHDEIGRDVLALSEKAMNEAAEEERQLALARNDVIRCPETNNILAYRIPVIADGCWLKRSYRTMYNSRSGYGVIVGHFTGKVLFVEVKNNQFKICDDALQKSVSPKSHDCFKNWSSTASSTSMEANAIAAGFQISLTKHKLVYNVLIADGDSSVYNKILDCDPYRSLGIRVKKLECVNHLLQNFANKVRNIHNAGAFRKQVDNSVLRMRTDITHAALHRVKEKVPLKRKIENLYTDITNVPSHVFGEHKRCQELKYFCDGNPKENERNIVPDLEKKGIYQQLQEIVKYVAQKSESLLHSFTNNAVETFNSLMAKYTSGKRLHLAQRGSYTIRVHLAVLQYNTGKKCLSTLSTGIEKEPPKMLVSMENRRINKSRKQKEKLQKESTERTYQPPRKKFRSVTKDHDYGSNVKEPDLEGDNLKKGIEAHMEMLKKWQSRRHAIERETVEQAFDDMWKFYRSKLLTASKFKQVCSRRADTNPDKLVISSIYGDQHEFETAATRYGKDNEEQARQDLSVKLGRPIEKCGLFIDSEFCFLGATPDGLIGNDTIVEIKCPYTARDMTPQMAIKTLKPIRSIFAIKETKG